MADADDKIDMERLRNGDDLALSAIMARWKAPVYSFCFRFTGNATDAQEIAQETFVRVFLARHRYQASESVAFSTWMFRIATNLCRMRHRWKKRHQKVFQSEGEQWQEQGHAEREAASGDPGKVLDLKILATDLDRAIRLLAPKLRSAFLLQEIQGFSQAEIAKIENTSTKAVERRVARAREQLRVALEAKWSPHDANHREEP